jgi:hypothetical protein
MFNISLIDSQNKFLDRVLESLVKSENADEKMMGAWKRRTSVISEYSELFIIFLLADNILSVGLLISFL